MNSSLENELKSFNTAAVRRAAENLMLQKENRKRRHSTYRALAVDERQDDTAACSTTSTTSPLSTRTTIWVTPHGKATIVYPATSTKDENSETVDTLQEDEKSSTAFSACSRTMRSRRDQAMHAVAHDLDEIHMLTSGTTKKPRLVPDPQDSMDESTTCLLNLPPMSPSIVAANRTTSSGTVVEPQHRVQATNTVTVVKSKRSVRAATKSKSVAPPQRAPRKKPTATATKTLDCPHPPNVYPGRTNPPHMDPNKFLSSHELKVAWSEHYRIEILKRQETEMAAEQTLRGDKGQQANGKPVSTNVLKDRHPNAAPVSASDSLNKPRPGNHLRKLPASSVSKTRPANKDDGDEKATSTESSPEHSGTGKALQKQTNAVVLPQAGEDVSAHSSSSTEGQQQQKSKEQCHGTEVECPRDKERRRLRLYEVEALEAFGVSTIKGESAKTTPVSTQFHSFLCWFKESVLNGQWVIENKVAPVKGWQTYVSRSILLLHLKRTPTSYLLGATMYQRPSTQAWLEQQGGNPGAPPYTISCNAMMELAREPYLGKVCRKWHKWSVKMPSVNFPFADTIFTYMIQKLIHTRRQGKLYQLESIAQLEHLLEHGPVNGRDLEVVTVVLEETPGWLL
jgi:hypothetical protein